MGSVRIAGLDADGNVIPFRVDADGYISRLAHGAFASINAVAEIPKTATWTAISTTTGSGLLLWVYFNTLASTDCQRTIGRIQLDGVIIHPYEPYDDLSGDLSLSDSTRPLQLTNYNVDGICVSCYYFPNGLRFDTTLLLEAQLTASAAGASTTYVHAGYETTS